MSEAWWIKTAVVVSLGVRPKRGQCVDVAAGDSPRRHLSVQHEESIIITFIITHGHHRPSLHCAYFVSGTVFRTVHCTSPSCLCCCSTLRVCVCFVCFACCVCGAVWWWWCCCRCCVQVPIGVWPLLCTQVVWHGCPATGRDNRGLIIRTRCRC